MSHFFACSSLHKISMASAPEGSTADTFFDADAAFGLAGPRHLAGASGATMPRARSRKVRRGGSPRRRRPSKLKAVEGAQEGSSRPGFSTGSRPAQSRTEEPSLVTTIDKAAPRSQPLALTMAHHSPCLLSPPRATRRMGFLKAWRSTPSSFPSRSSTPATVSILRSHPPRSPARTPHPCAPAPLRTHQSAPRAPGGHLDHLARRAPLSRTQRDRGGLGRAK